MSSSSKDNEPTNPYKSPPTASNSSAGSPSLLLEKQIPNQNSSSSSQQAVPLQSPPPASASSHFLSPPPASADSSNLKDAAKDEQPPSISIFQILASELNIRAKKRDPSGLNGDDDDYRSTDEMRQEVYNFLEVPYQLEKVGSKPLFEKSKDLINLISFFFFFLIQKTKKVFDFRLQPLPQFLCLLLHFPSTPNHFGISILLFPVRQAPQIAVLRHFKRGDRPPVLLHAAQMRLLHLLPLHSRRIHLEALRPLQCCGDFRQAVLFLWPGYPGPDVLVRH